MSRLMPVFQFALFLHLPSPNAKGLTLSAFGTFGTAPLLFIFSVECYSIVLSSSMTASLVEASNKALRKSSSINFRESICKIFGVRSLRDSQARSAETPSAQALRPDCSNHALWLLAKDHARGPHSFFHVEWRCQTQCRYCLPSPVRKQLRKSLFIVQASLFIQGLHHF